MESSSTIEVSRRGFMRNALVASAVAAFASAAWGARPTSAAADTASDAEATAEYVQELPAADSTTDWTFLDGVHDEYLRAVETFPFPLPDGYVFPSKSRWREPAGEANVRFSIGTGGAEAYMFWAGACSTAAFAAYRRGDADRAEFLLGTLEEGLRSSLHPMYVVDPDMVFINDTIVPATHGDYSALRGACIDPFIADPVCRSIAASAGDRF